MPGLLDPIKIGTLELKNRLVMPPMANQWALPTGEPTEAHYKHYGDRAEGVGLVIIEHACVLATGKTRATMLGLFDDGVVPAYQRLTDIVHAKGAKVAAQLNFAGAKSRLNTSGGSAPIGPSAITAPEGEGETRAMTLAEIEELVVAFGQAARRAKEAGFDAVEVHGAHGYVNNQFMSPITNMRTDHYGGSLENRMRLPLETTAAARRAVGPGYPLLYRIAGADLVDGGQSIEEGQQLAMALEKAGVDIMDVSAGMVGAYPSQFKEPGFFVPLAEAMRKVISIPVIGVGGITTAGVADGMIRQNRVDLVAVGRAILADPQWGRKAIEELQAAKPLP